MLRIPAFQRLARRLTRAAAVSMLFSAVPGISQAEEDPDAAARAILQRSDEIRFPVTGFEVAVRIRSIDAGGAPEVREFKVLSKGNENTIVLTTSPASERGQILLMKARDLWLFVPNVSQPVRLSLSQRLTGVVSNGDIARANFSGDYTPKLVGSETIEGQAYHVLELTAIDRAVTYQKVKYWVKQSSNAPLKAEFYSLSGRLLKTCSYEDYKQLGGKVRPTKLVMVDALKEDTRSFMDYEDMKNRELPDKVFTKEYLKKLE